jgi:hypothetical protein
MVALLKLDVIAADIGISLIMVAVIVTLISDLSTNVTFNPARSLVADLTPEGPARVRGYSWMQTVSGAFGISAYVISISLGNEALIWAAAAVTFLFTVLPLFFLEELAPSSAAAVSPGAKRQGSATWAAFKALLPMSGFMLYGVFIAADKLLLDNRLEALAVPLFLGVVALTLIWGMSIVWRGRSQPSPETRLQIILLGHGFSWLGVQSMFVMAFFFVRDFVVPTTAAHSVWANTFLRWIDSAEPTAANTAGNILSMGFLLLNIVGAALPVLVLQPLCLRWGKVRVHRTAIGTMALAYLLVAAGASGEGVYYAGMLLCGIGWSSLISIVFAIFSESVDSKDMGLNMGVFNSSLVLPALAVPGLLKLSAEWGDHRWMFVLFALCLVVAFGFWCAVSERVTTGGRRA